MARHFLVYCLILVINAHIAFTLAENEKHEVKAEAPIMARKLGKHNILHGKSTIAAPMLSPSASPKAVEGPEGLREMSASGDESGAAAHGQVMEMNHSHHHKRSVDKSICGGGVILGGLALIFLVAIFCYIRATGRKSVEPGSPSSSSMGKRLNPDNGSASPATTNSSC